MEDNNGFYGLKTFEQKRLNVLNRRRAIDIYQNQSIVIQAIEREASSG
jgi:hypothetical protein